MEYRMQRLHFTLSDKALNEAVDLLTPFFPTFFYPNAWRALMGEVDRRVGGQPPQDIRMMSGVFETLPTAVQRVLTNQPLTDGPSPRGESQMAKR